MARRLMAALLLMPAALLAQDPADSQDAQNEATGSFGFDFTNQYFFRGILQENQGVIAQPWWELSMALGDGGDDCRAHLVLHHAALSPRELTRARALLEAQLGAPTAEGDGWSVFAVDP